MNIAAVMATLDLWDLDHSAKHALLVIACRADRYTGEASVSIPRAAADMKAGYNAARLALDRVVKAGYLTVDKSPGQTSKWCLTPRLTRGVPRAPDAGYPAPDARGPRAFAPGEGVFRRKPDCEIAPRSNRGAGDNPARGVYDHLPNWTAERLNGKP